MHDFCHQGGLTWHFLSLCLIPYPHSYPMRQHKRRRWWWVVPVCLPAFLPPFLTQQGGGTVKTCPEVATDPQEWGKYPLGLHGHTDHGGTGSMIQGRLNHFKQLPPWKLRLRTSLPWRAVVPWPMEVLEAWSIPPGRPHWPHTRNSFRGDETETSHVHPSPPLPLSPFILHADTLHITVNYLGGH